MTTQDESSDQSEHESVGSLGSHKSADLAKDFDNTKEVLASPGSYISYYDISITESLRSTEHGDVATARRAAQRRAVQEAAANLSRLQLIVEEDEQMDESDSAQVDAFRKSLITAKRARLTNGESSSSKAGSSTTTPVIPVVQTALYNMQDVVVLKKLIDTPLAKKFRDQAKKPAFRCSWEDVIQPEAHELIKLRLVNMHVEMELTVEEATNWTQLARRFSPWLKQSVISSADRHELRLRSKSTISLWILTSDFRYNNANMRRIQRPTLKSCLCDLRSSWPSSYDLPLLHEPPV